MSIEVEAAAAEAVVDGAPRATRHARAPGSPCANCGTVLQGPWCHACGQFSDDYHRSVWHLAGEAVEGFLHFDGRVWRTLPDLVLHPARLTRAYVDGHRAPQVPPLRLAIVLLLLLFVSGSSLEAPDLSHPDRASVEAPLRTLDGQLAQVADEAQRTILVQARAALAEAKASLASAQARQDTEAQRAALDRARTRVNELLQTLGPAPEAAAGADPKAEERREALRESLGDVRDDLDGEIAEVQAANLAGAVSPGKAPAAGLAQVPGRVRASAPPTATGPEGPASTPANNPAPKSELSASSSGDPQGALRWINARARLAAEHPEEFKLILEKWSERFAFLLIPVAALQLRLLFLLRRDLYLYDHLVFATHSIAFQCLLFSVFFLADRVLPWGLAGWLVLAAPVHLYFHMRGFYGLRRTGTLVRMAALGVGSAIASVALVGGLLMVGLAGIGPG